MFDKILIANRGEIAVRIIGTARDLGYRTVAVFSQADADGLHVQLADEAVSIGPPAVSESYLAIDKIIAAAKKTKADAIHPGYGFLAENARFAKKCEEAGIIFIGPDAAAIELMGNKRLAKEAITNAGVACIPGCQGADQSNRTLIAEAEKIGFPVMVKAAAGGGGRGMRLVEKAADLAENLKSARSEAESAFGSSELILEKAVIDPRHIEVQIFADTHGNLVYLGERDCSIQRRHQKVVEEAPSPFVDEALRKKMGQAAVAVARACGYRGAGTVEFLVDRNKNFFFLEMNTRLQVEHPVTELITGLDLVAWQIDVAAGKPLPLTQEQINLNGHAIEARLYAEDVRQHFLPQTGKVLGWQIPQRKGVRVDAGIKLDQIVSPHYDPLLAKVIAWGKDRLEARRRLGSFLQDLVLLGINNNKLFLENILRHPVFAQGKATTGFIQNHFQGDASMSADGPGPKTLALAAMLFYRLASSLTSASAWHKPAGYGYAYKIGWQDKTADVALACNANRYDITVFEKEVSLEFVSADNNTLTCIKQGVMKKAAFAVANDKLYLDDGSGHFVLEDRTQLPAKAVESIGSGEVRADMDGLIIDVKIELGDPVEVGQTLVVLEAMKMEHPLKATLKGKVEEVLTAVGDQVRTGQLLIQLA